MAGNKGAGRPPGGQGRERQPAPAPPARPDTGNKVIDQLVVDQEVLRRAVAEAKAAAESATTSGQLASSAVVRLAGAVEKLGQRVDAVGSTVTSLRAELDKPRTNGRRPARRAAEEVAIGEPEVELPISWYEVRDERTAQLVLTTLVEWVERVYLRMANAGRMPACWMWHDVVVDELWTLFQAYCEAHLGENANGTKAADWRERYRKGAVERVSAELDNCGAKRHERGGDRDYRAPRLLGTEQIVDLAAWYGAGRSGDMPLPAPDLVAQESAVKFAQRRD